MHWACEVAFGYRETENTTLDVLLHSTIKNLPANAGDTRDVGSIPEPGETPGEEMATCSSILV